MLFEHNDLKPRNPYFSLALDEAICLILARTNSPLPFLGGFRLWSSPYSIILGRTCKPQKVLRLPLSLQGQAHHGSSYTHAKVPLCRRLSGGGTVIHGPGSLNYSIFLSLSEYPQMFSLKHSYTVLLDMIKDSLKAQDIPCTLAGLSDIALISRDGDLRKISGNAQFRRRQVLVLHGTLITRKEIIAKITEYLVHPPKEPDYRSRRKHGDFMGHLPPSFDFAAFRSYLSTRIRKLGSKTQSIAPFSLEQRRSIYALAHRIVRRQYMHPQWILEGQNPRSLCRESNAWELNPDSFRESVIS